MGENSAASMHVAWNTEQMEQNAQHPNRAFPSSAEFTVLWQSTVSREKLLAILLNSKI